MKSPNHATFRREPGIFRAETPRTDRPKHLFRPLFPLNPLFPPPGPATGSFNGLHPKRKFLLAIREGYIHSHGIALQALGKAGNSLLKQYPGKWKSKLGSLEKIDWSRQNATLWEGRALIGGKVSKVTTSITLTTNVAKRTLGLELSDDELSIEQAFTKGGRQ